MSDDLEIKINSGDGWALRTLRCTWIPDIGGLSIRVWDGDHAEIVLSGDEARRLFEWLKARQETKAVM